MTYWHTKDGKKLEIEWMDSVHIVNALNMLLRQGNTPQLVMKSHIFKEAAKRGLVKMDVGNSVAAAIAVPNYRETPIDKCMMRALLDVPGGRDYYPSFCRNRTAFIEDVNAFQHNPVLAQVWNEFVKNRMTRT